jgi:hypothetical protein
MVGLLGQGSISRKQGSAGRSESRSHSDAQHVSPGPPLPQIRRAASEDEHAIFLIIDRF